MLAVASAHPEIAGVVGYVPLEHPDLAAARLDELSATGRVCGIRNLIHDQSDPDWLRRPDVADGLALLESRDIPFDLVAVLPRHLEHAQYLSERFPGLRIVIDHLAKPPIGTDQREPWRTLMAAAAQNPNVFAKVSGLYPAAGAAGPATVEQLRPWLDLALDMFGADRLMIGSDWPVAVAYGDYDRVFGTLVGLVTGYGDDVAAPLLGQTAIDFYRLERVHTQAGSR
jgi:L-fuconolactonase